MYVRTYVLYFLIFYSYHMMWPTGEDSILRSDIIALIKYVCLMLYVIYDTVP